MAVSQLGMYSILDVFEIAVKPWPLTEYAFKEMDVSLCTADLFQSPADDLIGFNIIEVNAMSIQFLYLCLEIRSSPIYSITKHVAEWNPRVTADD